MPKQSLTSRQFERDRLVMERDKMRTVLMTQGKLSDTANHTEAQLQQRMQVHEALWFLYPMPVGENQVTLLILRLDTAAGNQPLKESVDYADLTDTPESWTAQLNRLDVSLSQRARGQLRRAALDDVNLETALSPEDVTALRDSLWQAPRVLLRFLKAAKQQQQDLRRVHLVPLGDAHALPWANVLSDALQESDIDLALRQYPSVSAWIKAQDYVQKLATNPTSPSLRPLVLHDDAHEFDRINPPNLAQGERARKLPMVQHEVTWTQELWRQQQAMPLTLPDDAPSAWPPAVDPVAPIDALFGVGHGGAPQEKTSDGGTRVNWARSGLWMPSWPDQDNSVNAQLQRYVSAAYMPALAHAVRLFMSCCVLGRTEDQLGEPLGLIALGFGFKTRVAIGSLLSVNDISATLISLAFQHRVIQRGGGSDIDWVDTFQELRRTLKSGQWPSEFQDWLREHLQTLIEELQQNKGEKRWVTWLDDLLNYSGWNMRPIAADAGSKERQAWLAEALSVLQDSVPQPPGAAVVQAIDWYVALG